MSTVKAQLLFRNPRQIRDRMQNKLDALTDRFSAPSNITDITSSADLEARIADLCGTPLDRPAGSLNGIERHIGTQKARLRQGCAPFDVCSLGTVTLGRLCYFTCRYLEPRKVVETGVAYGVTSSYILQALSDNGSGELYSIDLPPLAKDVEQHVGCLVPAGLRSRWRLRLGSVRKLLPETVRRIHVAEMFVCDSLHTYSHMKWEFKTALRSLRPGGVLIADDIEGNRAFEEITLHPSVASWFAIRQEGKDALCGVLRTKS